MFKKILFPLFLLGLVLILWRQAVAAPDSPTTSIVVNTDDDELNTDGDCSLREAIQAANTDLAVDACPAGSGADTITFSMTPPVMIMLSSQLPDVTSVITINGPGPNASGLVLNGGGSVRVLAVQSSGTLTLDMLTVANGYAVGSGGGISNMGGTVTITNSNFSGNWATSSGGSEGGGIANYGGSVNVTNSTFSGNSALSGFGSSSGGGIFNSGTVIITNSTFSDNSSTYGGGLSNYGSTYITNSTFSLNSAILSNGGGLYIYSGSMILANSLVANSTGGGDCANGGGTITDNGGNLVEDNSCDFPMGGDPMLGPLADNGGPTLTHALLLGSPALDTAILANCPPTDQRGISRPQGSGCDIGAFELEIATPTPTPTDTPTPTFTPPPPISTPGPAFLPLITSCFSGSEQEDNDSGTTANGPLCGPGTYTGIPDDTNDYFWFSTAAGSILIDLTNHTGADVQLQLYYQVVQGTPVCSDVVPPYHIECTNSPAGKYFIRVYTPPGSTSSTPYQLTVSFP